MNAQNVLISLAGLFFLLGVVSWVYATSIGSQHGMNDIFATVDDGKDCFTAFLSRISHQGGGGVQPTPVQVEDELESTLEGGSGTAPLPQSCVNAVDDLTDIYDKVDGHEANQYISAAFALFCISFVLLLIGLITKMVRE